ncbi:MAG: GNAT family N-acetyltransferase [Nocardioidaceae bacterium]
MDIRTVRGTEVDEPTGADIAALSNAAQAVDAPHLSPVSGSHQRLRLKHGWDLVPTDEVVLAYDGSALVGMAEVELPRWDNTHIGWVDIQTHPDRRGLGIGDRLLEIGLDLIRADGRTLLMSGAWAGSHREKFLLANGLTIGMKAAQRRLLSAELDWPRLDSLLAAARDASSAYEIIEVPAPTPPELIADIMALQQVMNDAPIDDLQIEDEVWPEERLRGYERASELRGQRLHRLVARRVSDGAMAGHTVVAVEDERPHLGIQEDTEVAPAHRGHKLGLRLKIEMLQRLREREPQIIQIDTWNAESNAHMIAVNELLGCFVVGRSVEMQKPLP